MKTNYKFTIALTLLLIGVVFANAQNPDVYIGGIKNEQAAIWKNEVPELFNAGQIDYLEMVGEDLYVAGLSISGVPTVWKNDEVLFTYSPAPSSFGSTASSMAIHNDDVYVTTIDITNNGFIGRLWINGVVSEDYEGATELYKIFFDGDDIYVAGGIEETAIIWKNAEPLYTHTSSSTGLFVDVKVVDGDVYYLGGDYGTGKCTSVKSHEDVNIEDVNIYHDNTRLGVNVWRNGEVLYFLGNVVYGASLDVSDGIVYSIGQVPHGGIYKASIWVNGEATIITDVWSGASGLCIYNDDVYATGFVGNYPELDTYIWKNGELTTLTSPGYDMGNCIIVVGETTDIEEVNDMCNIYPNPADDYILIEGVEFEEAVIYNSLGQMLVTTSNNKIDVSSLDSGLYLLKLDNNITRRIIIKH